MPFFCIGVETIVKIHEVQPQATSKLLEIDCPTRDLEAGSLLRHAMTFLREEGVNER